MPHEKAESEYTRGEVVALVAPVMRIPVEDIDNVVILTIGRCDYCDNRNGIGMVETVTDPLKIIELLELAIQHVLDGHMK